MFLLLEVALVDVNDGGEWERTKTGDFLFGEIVFEAEPTLIKRRTKTRSAPTIVSN